MSMISEKIEYRVVRSKRKTLSVNVSGGAVTVRAPNDLAEEKIAEFVERHRRWILNRLYEQKNRTVRGFADGDVLPICGKELTVAEGRTGIRGSELFLPAEGRAAALEWLLRDITRERMGGLLKRISKERGIGYSRMNVTDARKRWGSCSANGHICFSFCTAFLPDDLAEYLAVHELCHRLEMNHSERFWREVKKILPDYAVRRKKLKEYSWAMHVLDK